MPQIWLTYGELASLIGSDEDAARATASAIPLDRRKSRDGHTRAKLNARLAEIFAERLARHWIDREVATCASDLRTVREQMAMTERSLAVRPGESVSDSTHLNEIDAA